jgi:hypothetical protein
MEENECLFHPKIYVKRTPIHFVVHNGIQNNLIFVKVMQRLNFISAPPHL